MQMTLIPGQVSLRDLKQVFWTGTPARLDPAFLEGVAQSAAHVRRVEAGDAPIYGINTGFGKLASIKIDAGDTATLQRNLILSHCCGVGDSMPKEIVRLIMTLKLISLGRGASGVRVEIISQIEQMLSRGVIPYIPEKGSVGASGDLAPLAHMAAVVMGEGEAYFEGTRMAGAEALRRAGLTPVPLVAKEGLALINGTQASTALALAWLFRAQRALKASLVIGALSVDAAMASTAPYHPEVQTLRGHQGQIVTAEILRSLLDSSEIRHSHLDGDQRVQDPYCLRCQPQVAGACADLLSHAAHTLRIEANAVTDNPLILSDGSIVSGGNFHAEPVAFAADQIAIAICEIGAIAQRRIALLVDPHLSFGLPAFLARDAGLNSGYMIAEVTSAALMSENKQMAYPASVDSTPTSANQEDHVSMACHGARRLGQMNENLTEILGIELLIAAEGVALRGPLKTGAPLQCVIDRLRTEVPELEQDRYLAPDLAKASALVRSGAVVDALPEDTVSFTDLFSAT